MTTKKVSNASVRSAAISNLGIVQSRECHDHCELLSFYGNDSSGAKSDLPRNRSVTDYSGLNVQFNFFRQWISFSISHLSFDLSHDKKSVSRGHLGDGLVIDEE